VVGSNPTYTPTPISKREGGAKEPAAAPTRAYQTGAGDGASRLHRRPTFLGVAGCNAWLCPADRRSRRTRRWIDTSRLWASRCSTVACC